MDLPNPEFCLEVIGNMNCILCEAPTQRCLVQTPALNKGELYHQCEVCELRFLDPALRLPADDEFSRYQLHNNQVDDPAYHRFMAPMLELVVRHTPPGGHVLDFGCGAAKVLEHLLVPMGYHVTSYDSFFHNDPQVFNRRYDFIAAIEVFEHLYRPSYELERLRICLAPGGSLGVMTCLLTPDIDFSTWWYRKDPTHVTFFTARSFEWAGARWGFAEVKIESPRLALLKLAPTG